MAARRPSDSSPLEHLNGLVERVTFHNADTGFCVVRVKVRGQRGPVTVVGHAPAISPAEYVTSGGNWRTDREHGLQFSARFLKVAPPSTIEGMEKYLGSGMIRGIGPAYVWSRPSAIRYLTSSNSHPPGCAKSKATAQSPPSAS